MLSAPTIRRLNAERRAEDEWLAEQQRAEIDAELAIERHYENAYSWGNGEYLHDPWDCRP